MSKWKPIKTSPKESGILIFIAEIDNEGDINQIDWERTPLDGYLGEFTHWCEMPEEIEQ